MSVVFACVGFVSPVFAVAAIITVIPALLPGPRPRNTARVVVSIVAIVIACVALAFHAPDVIHRLVRLDD